MQASHFALNLYSDKFAETIISNIMKKVYAALGLMVMSIILTAQGFGPLQLNPPGMDREFPLMKALSLRASAKAFSTKAISLQDVSDLCWAGNGINRPESGKRTAPSAINAQDIDIYIFNKEGVYQYEASRHILNPVVKGDHRQLLLTNEYDPVPAMVCLLVSDVSLFRFGTDTQRMEWAAMDAGIVTQNILLFCASNEMLSRPRVGMDKEKTRDLLNLPESQHPMLNIPVSYRQD